MDIKYINPFLFAVKNVLEQFGVQDVKRGQILRKDAMHINREITAVLGLTGQVRGNVSYSLTEDTAKNIISTMMMGMPVAEIDAMGQSAISEFANMVTGNAMSILATDGIIMDISPPSVIFGHDISIMINSIQTITLEMECTLGNIEINIGLEV